MSNHLKICLASSSGGHFSQLRQLKEIYGNYETFWVLEKNQTTINFSKDNKVYYLKQQERKNIGFIFKLIINIISSLKLIIKERPNVIITTGAGAVFPACLFGKILGSKIIFIESYAKISSPTLTGKIIYKFADMFYVQWEEMLKFYPDAEYRGPIY